jgi:hypothetical protein
MKFIIYNSDRYYPFAEEYDTFEIAVSEFEKLKKNRCEEFERSKIPNGRKNCLYSDKDYLCVVLDECDVENGVK